MCASSCVVIVVVDVVGVVIGGGFGGGRNRFSKIDLRVIGRGGPTHETPLINDWPFPRAENMRG